MWIIYLNTPTVYILLLDNFLPVKKCLHLKDHSTWAASPGQTLPACIHRCGRLGWGKALLVASVTWYLTAPLPRWTFTREPTSISVTRYSMISASQMGCWIPLLRKNVWNYGWKQETALWKSIAIVLLSLRHSQWLLIVNTTYNLQSCHSVIIPI